MGLIDKLFDYSLFNRLNPLEHTTRVPMKIWTKLSLEVKGGMLVLSVNPQNVDFKQDKRVTSDVVKSGRVYYFWSETPGAQNLDILILSVKGTSGSILNRVALPKYTQKVGEQITTNPPEGALNIKHQKWMTLYAMTREAAYPTELNGVFNYAYIEYVSPLFPEGKKIIFEGHFNSPLIFSENADRPFLIDYNFDFHVHRTTPDLDIILEQANKILVNKE